MYKILTIAALFGLTLCLQACNTMEGAGEDISKGGQHLTSAAANAKSGN
jgi:predicted small secreted protein